jgi:hypothetical protein
MIESDAHGSSTNRFPAVPEKAAKVEMVPRKPDNWRAARPLPRCNMAAPMRQRKLFGARQNRFPHFRIMH